ncbi:uncharacterized protein LOC123932595 [Meles meles]|uniref:uncharacterized protein LOC123932595 n=1 Tax=Meles meles TaxID=9662 RepID=UPI001E69AF42|nr:uncharacterized protein LOC123932595 [Meles meles]
MNPFQLSSPRPLRTDLQGLPTGRSGPRRSSPCPAPGGRRPAPQVRPRLMSLVLLSRVTRRSRPPGRAQSSVRGEERDKAVALSAGDSVLPGHTGDRAATRVVPPWRCRDSGSAAEGLTAPPPAPSSSCGASAGPSRLRLRPGLQPDGPGPRTGGHHVAPEGRRNWLDAVNYPSRHRSVLSSLPEFIGPRGSSEAVASIWNRVTVFVPVQLAARPDERRDTQRRHRSVPLRARLGVSTLFASSLPRLASPPGREPFPVLQGLHHPGDRRPRLGSQLSSGDFWIIPQPTP